MYVEPGIINTGKKLSIEAPVYGLNTGTIGFMCYQKPTIETGSARGSGRNGGRGNYIVNKVIITRKGKKGKNRFEVLNVLTSVLDRNKMSKAQVNILNEKGYEYEVEHEGRIAQKGTIRVENYNTNKITDMDTSDFIAFISSTSMFAYKILSTSYNMRNKAIMQYTKMSTMNMDTAIDDRKSNLGIAVIHLGYFIQNCFRSDEGREDDYFMDKLKRYYENPYYRLETTTKIYNTLSKYGNIVKKYNDELELHRQETLHRFNIMIDRFS